MRDGQPRVGRLMLSAFRAWRDVAGAPNARKAGSCRTTSFIGTPAWCGKSTSLLPGEHLDLPVYYEPSRTMRTWPIL